MKQEDKELLRKDLCARLHYGVKVHLSNKHNRPEEDIVLNNIIIVEKDGFVASNIIGYNYLLSEIKPYLRPMSSMTEEEKEKLQSLHDIISDENYGDGYSPSAWDAITKWEDYCNLRHLDYRGLIEKGLAIEAPAGMYKEWISIRGNLKEDNQGNIVGGLKL